MTALCAEQFGDWISGMRYLDIGEPRLLELVRNGNPIYAWPYEQRHVWRSPHMPFAARLLERATRAR